MTGRSNLTIHQFRIFDKVVNSGSLTQAALSLDIPQPSISRVIARLEREVGTRLLNRAKTGVSLTAAGERFHRSAVRSMYYHDMAIEEARASQGLLIGEVRIAAPDSVAGILFAPLVKQLKNTHNGIRLRTIASQSSEIPAMLSADTIDIGIVADTHTLPPGIQEPLFREELYLVGPKASQLLRKEEISLADIADIPLILNAMPGGLRSLIDSAFSRLGVSPTVDIEIDANNALMALLGDGTGYSIVPYSLVVSAHSRSTLGAARLIHPSLVRTLFLLSAANRPVRTVVREVTRRIRTVVVQQAPRARWLRPETD